MRLPENNTPPEIIRNLRGIILPEENVDIASMASTNNDETYIRDIASIREYRNNVLGNAYNNGIEFHAFQSMHQWNPIMGQQGIVNPQILIKEELNKNEEFSIEKFIQKTFPTVICKIQDRDKCIFISSLKEEKWFSLKDYIFGIWKLNKNDIINIPFILRTHLTIFSLDEEIPVSHETLWIGVDSSGAGFIKYQEFPYELRQIIDNNTSNVYIINLDGYDSFMPLEDLWSASSEDNMCHVITPLLHTAIRIQS